MYTRTTRMVGGTLLVLTLSACGGGGSMAGMDHSTMASTSPSPSASASNALNDGGAMAGMASPSASTAPSMLPGMEGMDHSNMGGMMGTATANAPYDAQFIDSMIEHHQGAIVMAEDALKNAERPEIKQLAEAIISDQQKEVDQMNGWRQQWFPDLAPTGGMGMDMGDMTVGGDPNQPYDQRFITSMIAHHNGAIEMARDALTNAERPEIKQLAEGIITAQEAEIAQMQQWNREWFGA